MTRCCWFDLATRTGWACDGPTPGKPLAGVIQLPKGISPRYGIAYAALRSAAMKLIVEHRIEKIGFEAAINPMALPKGKDGQLISNPTSRRMLSGYVAVMEELAESMGIGPAFEAAAITIKKQFAGSGKAEKKDMLHMCKILGWDVGGDHNAADACGGWCYLKSLSDPGFSFGATPLARANHGRLSSRR